MIKNVFEKVIIWEKILLLIIAIIAIGLREYRQKSRNLPPRLEQQTTHKNFLTLEE